MRVFQGPIRRACPEPKAIGLIVQSISVSLYRDLCFHKTERNSLFISPGLSNRVHRVVSSRRRSEILGPILEFRVPTERTRMRISLSSRLLFPKLAREVFIVARLGNP